MIWIADDSWLSLPRKEALRVAERRWLESNHAQAGFSLERMAKETGESLSTLYSAFRRVGLGTDPKGRRSDILPSEEDDRQDAILDGLLNTQTLAVRKALDRIERMQSGNREIRDL